MYALGWLAVGAVVAVVAIVLVDGDEDAVSLPPVQGTELDEAARHAKCRLRRGERATVGLEPPVDGGPSLPAKAGTYTDELPVDKIVGALRRGVVVIYYRPGLDKDEVKRLTDLQASVPQGTIVVPDRNLPYEVAATAWRRLLGCEHVSERTDDAVRLFHGRYIGTGPEASR